jgi:geranylgeranyl reductase family protein
MLDGMAGRPPKRYDVLVVGAGPAGSAAAYRLAREGAAVALMDRVRFPRDKACGDLLSPRTVQALKELGISVEGSVQVGDLQLLTGAGRSLDLPWPRGASYPDRGEAIPRLELDEQLRMAALDAGAEFVTGNLEELAVSDAGPAVTLAEGTKLRPSFVIGADGSLSRVAELAGLTSQAHGLWGFALRYYVDATVERGLVVYWEPEGGRAFPGYGWVFPGTEGRVNLGLGISVGGSRDGANFVARAFPAFVADLQRRQIIGDVVLSADQRRGGWLKMGFAGTGVACGPVLLAGDAAGAINPLVGEGISGAILGGRDAADAILTSPGTAASTYTRALAARHGLFHPAGAALQAYMATHPRMLSLTGRIITTPGVSSLLARPWSMYWNDLVDGAPDSPARTGARTIEAFARLVTSRSRLRRRIERRLADRTG